MRQNQIIGPKPAIMLYLCHRSRRKPFILTCILLLGFVLQSVVCFPSISQFTKRNSATTVAMKYSEDEDVSVFERFTSPKIDDAGLPLSDALFAQIVAPTIEVFWLTINHSPFPTWLTPLTKQPGMLYTVPTQGSLLVPTLVHGAGLAVCWFLGALASKSYESDAFNVSGRRGYGTVIRRIVQGGAFSVGILIFSTQVDLLLEFGRYVQVGESPEIDARLLKATVELINVIVFEALVLSSWRIYRASLTNDPKNRPPGYDPDES